MSRPAQSRARDKAIPATTGFYLASRHLLVRKAGSGPRKSPLAGFLPIWLIFATEGIGRRCDRHARSEEHTSELQSLMRISYAVFCLKKKISTTCKHKL